MIGAGGVGAAIATSLASAGVAPIAVSDARPEAADALIDWLSRHSGGLDVHAADGDPSGRDLVVNAQHPPDASR